MPIFFPVLASILVLATVLPLWRYQVWWIRALDFPRAQIAVSGAVLTALWVFLSPPEVPATWLLLATMALAVLYQAARILPYTPLFPKEVRRSEAHDPASSLSLVVANVLMENRRADRLLEILARADPDVVLFVETDAWWAERLASLRGSYPHVVEKPLGNTYGMVLYSRLELAQAEVKFLVEEDAPSIHARMRLPCGRLVRFYGLHPKPPVPAEAEQTTGRDGELLLVGRELGRTDEPAVVLGDLNDVAWSSTTRLLRKVSGLLDPRIGRGLFSTFHAYVPILRWPLDHVFHSRHFLLAHLECLPAFGSDHLPIYARLVLAPWAASVQERPTADAADNERASLLVGKASAT